MRLMDADAVIARIAGQMSYEIETETGEKTDCIDLAEELLNDIPIIDAVEVVRCGECKYRFLNAEMQVWDCPYGLLIQPDAFCSYGERR